MEITTPYYEDLTRISNSNIGWFIKYGPAYLHKMLTNPPEEDGTAAMKRGTMIHMYLLQPEEFVETYEQLDITEPKSVNQKKFCEALANSIEIEPDLSLLNAYKGAYSTVGQSDDLMLSKAKEMASTLKSYIAYLKDENHKIKISRYDVAMLENIRDNVENHKLAKELLNPSEGETHHEFHINWNFCDVQCKSLLDSVNFDFKNKICTIVDLKTTVHIGCFEESMKEYDYLRQLCFYYQAVMNYMFFDLYINNIKQWTFKFYIIAIDTINDNEVRVFELSKEQIESRFDTIKDVLRQIHWHQETGNWDHHKEYYDGDGSETLEL